jgi:hypothetical protein
VADDPPGRMVPERGRRALLSRHGPYASHREPQKERPNSQTDTRLEAPSHLVHFVLRLSAFAVLRYSNGAFN